MNACHPEAKRGIFCETWDSRGSRPGDPSSLRSFGMTWFPCSWQACVIRSESEGSQRGGRHAVFRPTCRSNDCEFLTSVERRISSTFPVASSVSVEETPRSLPSLRMTSAPLNSLRG